MVRFGKESNCMRGETEEEIGISREVDLSASHVTQIWGFAAGLKVSTEQRVDGHHIQVHHTYIRFPELVEVLDLTNNQLTSLPKEIGKMRSLRELRLSKNQLVALPPEIGYLESLKHLDLEDNHLYSLPDEIRELCELGNLNALFLHGNPRLGLPPEILGPRWKEVYVDQTGAPADPQVLVDMYYALRTAVEKGGQRQLNEVKVLVVGQGSVGKTSLIRRMIDGSFDEKEDKTPGIKRYHKDVICAGLGQVRMNIWDFGGQEIMHATHQFFLTKRSVYLLVLDSRLGEWENRLHYWLRLIASYGGGSPIIVVCNKCDQQKMELAWNELRSHYPQIAAYAREVSCRTEAGLDQLQDILGDTVASYLPEVEQLLPQEWVDLKQNLEDDGRDCITLREYHSIAQGFGLKREGDRKALLKLLHELGSVLHFSEHAIFDEERRENAIPLAVERLNVLNPGWVTDAVYKLLNDAEILRSGGVLDLAGLRRSLGELPNSKGRYDEKEDFIISMMRRFQICFPFEGERLRWLLPDLLPKDEVHTGDWPQEVLAFRMSYEVLPTSVLSRLMVRRYTEIAPGNLWRSGVLFLLNGCEALVRATPEAVPPRLDIAIRGGSPQRRRNALDSIREELWRINRSFRGNLGLTEYLRVPEEPSVFVEYETLLLIEAKWVEGGRQGDLTYDVKIPGKSRILTLDVLGVLSGAVEERNRERELKRLEYVTQGSAPLGGEGEVTSLGSSKKWFGVSVLSALCSGILVLLMKNWENDNARLFLVVSSAVFVLLLLLNPALKFRRHLHHVLGGWLGVNAIGFGLGVASEDVLVFWDGAVGWSFNVCAAVVVVVMGFLAWEEWRWAERV